jgi:hypothetical protein
MAGLPIRSTLADIISNGSFESPAISVPPAHIYNPTGAVWTFTGSSGIVNPTGNTTFEPPTPPPNGKQEAFLQYSDILAIGQFSQSIFLPTSGEYALSYYVGGRQKIDHSGPGGSLVDGSLSYQILLDGNVIAADTTTSFQQFTPRNYSFSASSGSHAITFQALNTGNDHTAFFDSIAVTVPEPSTFILLLSSVIGSLLLWHRRR